MSVHEKFDQIQEQGTKILENLSRQLEEFKKKNLNKIIHEIKNHKKEWENEFNKNMVTKSSLMKFKLKLPNLNTLQKFMKKNLAKIPENLTKNESIQISEISENSESSQNLKNTEKLELSEDSDSSRNKEEVDEDLEEFYKDALKKNKFSLKKDSLRFLISNVFKNKKMKLQTKYKIKKKQNKFEAVKFQKYTEKMSNLLIICVSEEGEEFGGFAKTGWNSEDKDYASNFIFSLTKRSIHKQIRPMSEDFSLEYIAGNGPCFGPQDLVIGDNPQLGFSSTSHLGNLFEFDGPNPQEYLAGAQNFKLRECFVYEIKYLVM